MGVPARDDGKWVHTSYDEELRARRLADDERESCRRAYLRKLARQERDLAKRVVLPMDDAGSGVR